MRGFGRVQKERFVLQRTPTDGRVLHIGCTNSPRTIGRLENKTLLHEHILERCPAAVGIDIDGEAIDLLRERFPKAELVAGDAHHLNQYFNDRRFDLIIAGDVIEHLPNPGLFLDSCRDQLAPNGKILVTTANTFHIGRFIKSLLFHEAVHSEHTAYFSPKTLSRIGHMCGLDVAEYGYYACEKLTGFSLNRALTNGVEIISTVLWPQLSDGVIAVFKKEA